MSAAKTSKKKSNPLVPRMMIDGFERDIQESYIRERAPEILETPFDVKDEKMATYDVTVHYLDKNHRMKGYVKRADIKKNSDDVKFDKVFVPKAGGSGADALALGEPILAGKNSVCSQTYLYAKFSSRQNAENFISYLRTKSLRALVSAIKVTQDALSRVYQFVPMQDFSEPWDDAKLYKKYKLTREEIAFIESMIKPME